MNTCNRFLFTLLVCLCLGAGACTPQSKPKPTITLSETRIPSKSWIKMHGTGFTPKANISSHLRRPNGTEFPVLPIYTNDRGEFSHEIDTLLLDVGGKHDLWVIDDTSQVSSNVIQFEVTPY